MTQPRRRHRVTRRSPSGRAGATLVTPTLVRLFFQKYPGAGGADEEVRARSVGRAPFTATYGTHAARGTGHLNSDGSVEIYAWPDGSTNLNIFGTQFTVVPQDIEPPATDQGAEQRLEMLGYADFGTVGDQVSAAEDDYRLEPREGVRHRPAIVREGALVPGAERDNVELKDALRRAFGE